MYACKGLLQEGKMNELLLSANIAFSSSASLRGYVPGNYDLINASLDHALNLMFNISPLYFRLSKLRHQSPRRVKIVRNLFSIVVFDLERVRVK